MDIWVDVLFLNWGRMFLSGGDTFDYPYCRYSFVEDKLVMRVHEVVGERYSEMRDSIKLKTLSHDNENAPVVCFAMRTLP